jgi:hypothetical protein
MQTNAYNYRGYANNRSSGFRLSEQLRSAREATDHAIYAAIPALDLLGLRDQYTQARRLR